MQDFNLYFQLGIEHILTWEALDHILFVAALCLRYLWKDWKKVLILVTAFTIGHSITLLLTSLGHLDVPIEWIEFFVPLTIAATALNNLLQKQAEQTSKLPVIYFLALFFGLIHGMAYASTIISLEGKDGIVGIVFAFNVGIELAQLVIVAGVLLISYILVQLLKLPRLWWMRIASILILVVSLKMAFDRIPGKSQDTSYRIHDTSFKMQG